MNSEHESRCPHCRKALAGALMCVCVIFGADHPHDHNERSVKLYTNSPLTAVSTSTKSSVLPLVEFKSPGWPPASSG